MNNRAINNLLLSSVAGRASYPTTSGADGTILSRLDNIAPDSSGTTQYAQYGYLGTGTIFNVNHPAVNSGGNLILNYDPAANGTYSGLDQFGQVVDQKWTNSTPATLDEYQYAYDGMGNRTYRQNSGTSGLDEAYVYDDLNRVTDLQRGTLSGSTITGTPVKEEQFTLEELGN
jgi:hypothetical protein